VLLGAATSASTKKLPPCWTRARRTSKRSRVIRSENSHSMKPSTRARSSPACHVGDFTPPLSRAFAFRPQPPAFLCELVLPGVLWSSTAQCCPVLKERPPSQSSIACFSQTVTSRVLHVDQRATQRQCQVFDPRIGCPHLHTARNLVATCGQARQAQCHNRDEPTDRHRSARFPFPQPLGDKRRNTSHG